MLVWAQVMAYRTDAFRGAVPVGWADFWDTKKFPGDRAMVGTGNGGWPELEFALMAAGVPPDKVYPIDIDKAFGSYEKIKKDVIKWWDTGALPIQLLTDREVVMTSVWNGRMAALQASGVPAAISWSQGMLKRDCWAVPWLARRTVPTR
jgi:putative spermidine/putrescine transport system substrate-binding protein